MSSNAEAHFPFHFRHCYHSHGWGSHYYGGYSSFSIGYSPRIYSTSFYSSGFCSPSYYRTSYFAPSYYYTPTYCTPSYLAPVYYTPSYFAPTYYYAPAFDPCNAWSSVQPRTHYSDTSFTAANSAASRVTNAYAASRANTQSSLAMVNRNSPLTMPARGLDERVFAERVPQERSILAGLPVSKVEGADQVARVHEVDGLETLTKRGTTVVAKKPALVQPYSPIWTKAAVGIVDDMVAAGEFEHAYSSCKSMDRVTQAKGAGVYLRQALMSYFADGATSGSTVQPSTDDTLNRLATACEFGSNLLPDELSKSSLHDYFAHCSVDVSKNMDELSKRVLESGSGSGKELLLLAALLKLDGQSDRAKLFATEVESRLSTNESQRWLKVLEVCLTNQ
jgi:hypothetical protein